MPKYKMFIEFSGPEEMAEFVKKLQPQKSGGYHIAPEVSDILKMKQDVDGFVDKVKETLDRNITEAPKEDPEPLKIAQKCKREGCENDADPHRPSGYCSSGCYMKDYFKRQKDAKRPARQPKISNRQIG